MKSLARLFVVFCVCNALALIAYAGPEPSGKEMKQVAPAPPSCDFNWTGFYIGANIGYSWGDADTHFEALPDLVTFFDLQETTLHPNPAGIIGGGQIGYNYQWGPLLVGAEADFQASDLGGTERVTPILDIRGVSEGPGTFIEAHERTDWFGTARARVGFTPFCRLLVYGTGGLAYGHVNYAATTSYGTGGAPVYPTSFDKTKVGWTAGFGGEYAITHRWSVKLEYLYYDLGDESAIANATPLNPPYQVQYDWETKIHTVRGGLNFKF